MPRVRVNGISLNVEAHGVGPPLVLLHGFTGCAANWRPLVERLHGFECLAVDLVGHGASDSPAELEHYRMASCVRDLAALLDALALEAVVLHGYSMGGRTALHFAFEHPGRLRALVLESASPGIDDPSERAARVRADEDLAHRIDRDGIEAFVDYWESLPLWESQRSLPAEARAALRAQRLRNDPVGLANSLRGMGAGAQAPVSDRLGELGVPTLFVAGALDRRYADLARVMAAKAPRAEAVVVPDAGHAVHFERPAALAAVVNEFLPIT